MLKLRNFDFARNLREISMQCKSLVLDAHSVELRTETGILWKNQQFSVKSTVYTKELISRKIECDRVL